MGAHRGRSRESAKPIVARAASGQGILSAWLVHVSWNSYCTPRGNVQERCSPEKTTVTHNKQPAVLEEWHEAERARGLSVVLVVDVARPKHRPKPVRRSTGSTKKVQTERERKRPPPPPDGQQSATSVERNTNIQLVI
ncbi:hypothetical protein NQZ68_025591 [Dissostichus eleginoides]|nr:hypothetical protein NQZ68_025591 [Dissostichus eleginoides]